MTTYYIIRNNTTKEQAKTGFAIVGMENGVQVGETINIDKWFKENEELKLPENPTGRQYCKLGKIFNPEVDDDNWSYELKVNGRRDGTSSGTKKVANESKKVEESGWFQALPEKVRAQVMKSIVKEEALKKLKAMKKAMVEAEKAYQDELEKANLTDDEINLD